MIEKSIRNCPDDLWDKEIGEPPFWQQMYHTLFYLDFYLGKNPNDRPSKFSTKENLNEKVQPTLSKEQLLDYLGDIKKKCSKVLDSLSSKELEGKNSYHWTGPTLAHRLLYNVRHTQHHIGKFSSILRRNGKKAAKWLIAAKK